MTMRWLGGDQIRHDRGAAELQAAGLSAKAAELLVHTGVFSVRELLETPWSDEDAGRRFVGLQWRLSVSSLGSDKLSAQIETVRAQLLRERRAA
jgi:hypothetical protein